MKDYIKIIYEAHDLESALTKQDYFSDVFENNDNKFRTQILMYGEIYLVEFLVEKQ